MRQPPARLTVGDRAPNFVLPDPRGKFQMFYERVKGAWEERFERTYGFWRGVVDGVVLAFQACGDFEGGFARVYCDACRVEYLVAFSCSRRVFCPSCAAKRAAIFGVLLREDILEEVGHAQWVFTIPKLIRPYFLHHRELLGKLSQAAWETVQELMAEAGGDDGEVRAGMVSVMQTATDLLEWHPHAQYLALSTPLFSYRSVP